MAEASCAAQPAQRTVYFERGVSDLTPYNAETIYEAVARARAGGCSITLILVEGHMDSSEGSNDSLSQRRALSVKTALVNFGVAVSSITTAAKGKSDPALPSPDGTPEPLNRRVEVQITIGY